MGKKRNIARNFAMQATILAVASILSKLIGMLYNIPFANILSKEGNGYYGSAQTIYAMILLIATFSIPSAISKIMAERIEKHEYKNVKRIFHASMIYVFLVGGVAAVFTYFAAPWLVTKNAVLSLRILAPTIFFSGFLSVYRGYFQAYGNMVPTSISQIIEQVFHAIVSIVAAILFMKLAVNMGYGADTAKYGAAGGTLGTCIAVLTGLFYMFFLFHKEKKLLHEKIALDGMHDVMSYKEIFRLLFMIATPIIFSSFIYNVNVTVDMTIFYKILGYMGMDEIQINAQYGLYNRMYLVLANVPIAMAAAVASAVIPRVSSAYATNNMKECNRKIHQSMQLTMVLTVPCAVGFITLAYPIVDLIYMSLSNEDTKTVAGLLILGGVSIVLYGISSVLNGVLQGIGKVNIPVFSAATALVLHIFLFVPLVRYTDLGVYSFIFATAFYALIIVFMNYKAVKKYLEFRMEWKQTIWVPLASSIIMGVVAFMIYHGLYWMLQHFSGDYVSNAIAVLCSILIAVIVYFIAMIKIGGYTKEMLFLFPKGEQLVKVVQKLHLIKDN